MSQQHDNKKALRFRGCPGPTTPDPLPTRPYCSGERPDSYWRRNFALRKRRRFYAAASTTAMTPYRTPIGKLVSSKLVLTVSPRRRVNALAPFSCNRENRNVARTCRNPSFVSCEFFHHKMTAGQKVKHPLKPQHFLRFTKFPRARPCDSSIDTSRSARQHLDYKPLAREL